MGIFGKPNIEKLKEKRDVDGLIRALKHSDWLVHQRAAGALGKIDGPRATEALIELLGNSDRNNRQYAVSALAEIGDARAVNSIIGALRDSSYSVRLCAAEALGKIKDGKAIAPLMKALGDEEPGIRREAAKALAGFRLNRGKILEKAEERACGADYLEGSNFFALCEKCGEPCEVLGLKFAPEVLRVMSEPHLELARYCEKCNIVVCARCARAGYYWETWMKHTMFFGGCPHCGEDMEFAAAYHVKNTATIVAGASWLDLKDISEIAPGL